MHKSVPSTNWRRGRSEQDNFHSEAVVPLGDTGVKTSYGDGEVGRVFVPEIGDEIRNDLLSFRLLCLGLWSPCLICATLSLATSGFVW